MEEVRHKTAAAWVGAMNRSHELLQGDDKKRRVLGFYDHTDEKHHIIKVADMLTTSLTLPPKQSALIETVAGLKKLIEGE